MKDEVRRLARKNLNLAKGKWVEALSRQHLQVLRSLTEDYGFAVALGDLLLLEGGWYVTNAGLLRLAARSRCNGIRVEQVRNFCDPVAGRWVFKATVYKSPSSKGFVGYGDADPSNVSSLVRGAEMRVAETRAVNRALRKAYGIGLCSVEELGSFVEPQSPRELKRLPPQPANGNDGGPKVRDRLCQI